MPTCTLSHCRVRTIQSQPRVFSAGLDILEMYRKSPERCGEFWRAVQEMWLKLYSSNMVTIAAINVGVYHSNNTKLTNLAFYLTCTVHVRPTWGCGIHSLVNPYRPSVCLFCPSPGIQPCRRVSDVYDLWLQDHGGQPSIQHRPEWDTARHRSPFLVRNSFIGQNQWWF